MADDERRDPYLDRPDDELADSIELHEQVGSAPSPRTRPADAAVDLTKSGAPGRSDPHGAAAVAGGGSAEPVPSEAAEPAATEASDPAATDPADVTDASGGRHRRRRRDRKPRRKAPWWELPALVVLAILIAILVKSFVIQPFYIPSQSMEKTLHGCPGCSGDRILVNKLVYDIRDPHPGDIVVFNAPPGWDDEPRTTPPSNPVLRAVRGFGQLIGFVPPDGLVLVKRVIATGGQTVRGSVVDGKDVVQVSDHGTAGPWRTLDEPFVYLTATDTRGTFGPVTVPKGRLWVMGDHRDESADSRYHCGPGGTNGPDGRSCNSVTATVPIDNVIGKAVVIAWPPSRWTTLGTPKTFTEAAAAGGAVPFALMVPLFFVRRRRRRR